MRVLFGAPRKTGNAYLRCLLTSAYGWQVVGLRDAPQSANIAALSAWLADMPEESVAGASLPCSPDLRSLATERHITLLGVIRHPFDLFLSNYEIAQQKAARDKGNPEDEALLQALAGHPLEDHAVLAYARHDFADEIAWLRDWHDGAAYTIRYEQLLSMPAAVLTALLPTLGPLTEGAITRAVNLCQAENLVISRPARGRRMPAVPPRAWRERLPATLQSVLRQHYASDVAYLGYDPD